ncbi:MAG: PAS domain-containing sensor histidine kinase [Bacteroidetes bacterium]|nr:PAS domain-containing sensor histidine kinase [Bacteroidota bacterium]
MESLDAMFKYATEGIIIADSKGSIIRANPSSEKLFGYEKGELLTKVVEDLIPKRFSEHHVEHRKHYNEHPRSRSMGKNMTLYGKRKDETEFPVEISLSHYKRDDETLVIAFIIDVTERKQHEENINRLNRELEKKVGERTKVLEEALMELERSKEQLSQALEKEKQLNDMKSRFVTMASHEFRTPLSTILSSVSLIGKYTSKDDDEKRQRHVARIKSSVTNMTLILNDFLSAERLEEGKIFANNIEFSVPQLTKEIITEIKALLKQGQIIEYTHEGIEDAFLDKQMARNILLNLISNAIKFSGENKKILVHTKISETETSITVTDEGIGIPKDEQEHLFNRFFRAKNVTNIQGTGLGLNIVAKYLEALNGQINFTSELNIGTTFRVTIPNTK